MMRLTSKPVNSGDVPMPCGPRSGACLGLRETVAVTWAGSNRHLTLHCLHRVTQSAWCGLSSPPPPNVRPGYASPSKLDRLPDVKLI